VKNIFGKVLVLTAGVALVAGAAAAPSMCDAEAGNIVTNCGFEGGVYTDGSGVSVPNGWTANAGFDLNPGFNHVTNSPINSGGSALSIGNYTYQAAPVLSQILSDTAGNVYNGSVWVEYGGGFGAASYNGDPPAFLDLQVNGGNLLALNNDSTPGNTYTEFTFAFVATGSDTLALTGNTDPSEWFVDDVTITNGGPAGQVPEPASLWLAGVSLLALGLARRKPL